MKAAIFVFALAAGAASSAFAGPFVSLCDTGVSSISNCSAESPVNGTATAEDADTNFTVTQIPSGSGGIATPYTTFTSGFYYQSGLNPMGTNTASWITTVNSALTPSQAVGNFNYQEAITATVTGMVTISGKWAVDNCGTIAWGAGSGTAVSSGSGLTIGGGANASACTSPLSAFGTPTAFSFNESVTAGTVYDLDFNVYNSGSVTGLFVDSLAAVCTVGTSCSGGTNTPEPSSVVLTLTGLGVLGLGLRRLAGK